MLSNVTAYKFITQILKPNNVYRGDFLPPQNRSALCGHTFAQEKGKTVQIISLRYSLCLKHNFYMLFIPKSAPNRLTPNEALPHTPIGLCPVPTSPLTPGPRLRFIFVLLAEFIFLHKKALHYAELSIIVQVLVLVQVPV